MQGLILLTRFNSFHNSRQIPSPIHLQATKRVLRYLQSSQNLHLTYKHNCGITGTTDTIQSYSDANVAADEDRKSISGYDFTLAESSIFWQAKKQRPKGSLQPLHKPSRRLSGLLQPISKSTSNYIWVMSRRGTELWKYDEARAAATQGYRDA